MDGVGSFSKKGVRWREAAHDLFCVQEKKGVRVFLGLIL
jgi:hypothetical protein